MSTGSLAGLRVLDISTIIAGGMASSMLADQGAEVFKIEMPGVGDPARHMEPRKNAVSFWHKVAGRNKKSLTLALGDPRGVRPRPGAASAPAGGSPSRSFMTRAMLIPMSRSRRRTSARSCSRRAPPGPRRAS